MIRECRIPVNVGLDYHSDSIQVAILDRAGKQLLNRNVRNSAEAIVELLRPYHVEAVAIEACPGSACLADELVDEHGLTVHLAHAGYVSKLKQSPDKTDYSDARLLGDLARVGYLPRVWHAPKWIRELRTLVRHRQALVNHRRAVKLRILAVLRDQRLRAKSRAWTLDWFRWLEHEAALSAQGRWTVAELLEELEHVRKKVDRVERRMREYVKDDPIVQILMMHKGIGLVIATTLRAEVGRFDRFRKAKQLSNFCGLSPRNASSGRRMADAGLLAQANRALRAVIIQGAHLLMRHNPRWRAMAEQMLDRGKPYSVVVAAVANRWMRTLHHDLKHLQLAIEQDTAA